MSNKRGALTTKDKQGVVIIIITSIVLIILLAFYVKAISSPERAFDKVTMCNDKMHRQNHNVIVIDVSDPLSPHQKRYLPAKVLDIVDDAARNDRFTVFVLDKSVTGLSKPIADVCKPKSPDDVNILTENERFLTKNFQEKFLFPMNEAIAELVEGKDMEVSPIYESISDLKSLNILDKSADKRTVFIISDMLQNTPFASVYSKGEKAIDDLPKFSLESTDVYVFWLDRDQDKKYQTKGLAESWAKYLDAVANLREIERVRY
ncbi:hypothetical protein [Ferrimonas gelatinilytica]|uniref:CHASE2 domain-containing protein n=1 Tax=Ferrimonas gelatinilytica TaxID=1255257 RepID=A0ABP9S203_9GAMM